MTDPRPPRYDRSQVLKSYGLALGILLLPTLLVLNTKYGTLAFPFYIGVFIYGVSGLFKTDLIERSKGFASLLGCGTIILLLIPVSIMIYVSQ